MRSLQAAGEGRIDLIEIPEYLAGVGEVLIRPIATGICGTDLDIIDGRIDPAFVRYPVTIGHEWCGVVVAHGAGVNEPPLGARVAVEGIIACGDCRECLVGATNRCDAYSEIGFTRPGGAADLVAVPASQAHVLRSDVSDDSACLIEPASVVIQAIRKADPAPNSRVLVIGDGTIGLIAATLIQHWQPERVDLVGAREEQAGLAARAGVDRFASTNEGIVGTYDLVIEAAGAASALTMGINALARGGKLVALGFPGQGVTIPLAVDNLVNGDYSIIGSFGYSRTSWAKTVELLNSGKIDLSFIVTHRFSLNDWSEAIDCLRNGRGVRGKVLLTIS